MTVVEPLLESPVGLRHVGYPVPNVVSDAYPLLLTHPTMADHDEFIAADTLNRAGIQRVRSWKGYSNLYEQKNLDECAARGEDKMKIIHFSGI